MQILETMPKEDRKGKKNLLSHNPLDVDVRKPNGKLKAPRSGDQDDDIMDSDEDNNIPKALQKKIYNQARDQRIEAHNDEVTEEDHFDDDVEEEEDEDGDDELVNVDGDYVEGANLSAEEEAVVAKFLNVNRAESRTLADIIMDKIKQKEVGGGEDYDQDDDDASYGGSSLPPKVVEVYTSVGKMLHHYRSGKLPKALKMLPHLRNWEEVLWITRPDEWSPLATYACTRIFASNLNAKMAQRFFNVVLLEKVRDDIRRHNKLNYHLYLSLKKALFKPAAFYKGLLLPLAMSRTCNLREATIVGSVVSKVSVPANHSAAVLLKLAEMPYSGSTSFFIRIFINKRYALPRRVVDALVTHFCQFETDTREMPVIWHQSLLAFVQRYKFELSPVQKDQLRALMKAHPHHTITPEVRRELFAQAPSNSGVASLKAVPNTLSDDVEMSYA